jgi:hypothetical protein
MAGFSHDLFGGNGVIIAVLIKSPNYAAGSAGWAIKRDGSAEFNNVTIRGGEVVGGTALYYSGAPGAGDLIASIAGGNVPVLTDPYGNTFYPGVWTYNGSKFAGLSGDALNIQDGSFPWQVTVDHATGYLVLQFPHLGSQLYVANTGSAATLLAQEPGNLTPETWHAVSYLNSWTTDGEALSYKLMPDATVQLSGRMTIPAGVTNPSTVCTLPTGYVPARTEPVYVIENPGPPYLAVPHYAEVTTGGNLTIYGAMTAGNTMSVSARYPLDA